MVYSRRVNSLTIPINTINNFLTQPINHKKPLKSLYKVEHKTLIFCEGVKCKMCLFNEKNLV